MTLSDIFLILISGLGVLHGLLLAVFLWGYAKGDSIANKLLSSLFLVLSFRVGKSVFLEFAEHLSIQIIFIGLATLMSIGPLFYFYTQALIDKHFKWKKSNWLVFIPTLGGIGFGCWITEDRMVSFPKVVILIIFLIYYGHYLFYIFKSYRCIKKAKKSNMLKPIPNCY